MNPEVPISAEVADLIDGYLEDSLDAAQLRRLEECLIHDGAARRYFAIYCQNHTHLNIEARARRASDRAVARIISEQPPRRATEPSVAEGHFETSRITKSNKRPARGWRRSGAIAAALLMAISLTWWAASHFGGNSSGTAELAWLANAQNCQWAPGASPDGGLSRDRILRLQRGLAEVRFRSGATVVVEGPASLQLLSANSARLLNGRLTARVPEAAKGFQIITPRGKVVDLGTEFGLAVADDGSADVIVFKGKVEAYGTGNDTPTPLGESRTARIGSGSIIVDPAGLPPAASKFTREIGPVREATPRTITLDFRRPMPASLKDGNGIGTGLQDRLPGTGISLATNDPNLRLDPVTGLLELTTTRSDINTQYQLPQGEYLGTRLSSLGFTGREDFEVTAVITNIPTLAAVGQLGLYAGSRSERNIRGGLISRRVPDQYRQFLVNNDGGKDSDSLYVGVLPTGSDVRLSLRRISGKYSMSVESLSDGAASTLSIRHPQFLDGESDLYVGLFAANTGSDERRKIAVKEYKATVWVRTSGSSE